MPGRQRSESVSASDTRCPPDADWAEANELRLDAMTDAEIDAEFYAWLAQGRAAYLNQE